MSTLEDKILGNKLHCYCSSSEDEDDDKYVSGEEEDLSGAGASAAAPDPQPSAAASAASAVSSRSSGSRRGAPGTSSNTGPKGVIQDWQRFKQLENEKREDQERERLELFKKLSLTCQSAGDEDKERAREQQEMDPELQELLADTFLLQYQEKRMKEMLDQYNLVPAFGQLLKLDTSQEFLDAIDKENKSVTVIIHIYENNVAGCEAMNGCLTCLSEEFPAVKFCCILSTAAGMSKRFKLGGVPALLVYKAGQLIGNFVRITDDLGTDFFADEVEGFLKEHGVLPDKTCVPKIIQDSHSITN